MKLEFSISIIKEVTEKMEMGRLPVVKGSEMGYG